MKKTTIEELYSVFKAFPKAITDTRKPLEDSIYFALKGENFDGNKFAEEALVKGAAYAVIDNPAYAVSERFLLVDNVLSSLQQLAKFHRQKLKLPIVGITGSNGKTTTKELLRTVLERKYKTSSTEGNLNNHIGVPLTVLSITEEHEIAIVEMGANHIGEIADLCEICQPDYGIITNIGKAHLEGFGSYEGVKTAKSELYRFIEKAGGTVFVNSSDSLLMELASNIKKVGYGEKKEDYCQAKALSLAPKIEAQWETTKENGEIHSNLFGEYNYHNLLCAVCVAAYFEVPAREIDLSLSSFHPQNNRSQLIQTKKNKIVLDAYNANPSSMEVAISTCHRNFGRNVVFILGDMFELGKESAEEHKRIVDLLKEQGTQNAILIGKEFFKAGKSDRYHFFEDRTSAEEFLKQNPPNEKVILIKGSRGMQLEKLLPFIP